MKQLLMIVFILCCSDVALAANVMFQWDANTDGVDGYKIYCSPTNVRPFKRYSTLNGINHTSVTISLPIETATQYCAATAWNVVAESVYSNIVIVSKPVTQPKSFRRK